MTTSPSSSEAPPQAPTPTVQQPVPLLLDDVRRFVWDAIPMARRVKFHPMINDRNGRNVDHETDEPDRLTIHGRYRAKLEKLGVKYQAADTQHRVGEKNVTTRRRIPKYPKPPVQ